MTHQEIRTKFLKFFEERGHKIVPSSSLLPEDSTTLFTGSGMQPMVPYLLGEEHPLGKRIADSQKSFRAEDIEEVGDNRHTTFFEMLGNWSFGDYWKEEQLSWIFDFWTNTLGIDPGRLYVTVFAGDPENNIPRDAESARIWKKLFKERGIAAKEVDLITLKNASEVGMGDGRIFFYGPEKNWWSRTGKPNQMPAEEPGGPDSEVFFQFDVEHDAKFGKECHPNCDCGRHLEIGNNVFMEYQKQNSGTFEPLPQKNVDFGGGLERTVAASNNNPDVFVTSAFRPIIDEMKKIVGNQINEDDYANNETARKTYRIIADHIKAATILISDGITPSNKDRGYVVRRLIRRAIRYAKLPGFSIKQSFTTKIADAVIQMYSNEEDRLVYDDLESKRQLIHQELLKEEERFSRTLSSGLKEISKLTELNGVIAFKLYESFGFPFELTEEIARERGQKIEYGEFKKAFETHKAKSREGAEKKFGGHGLILDTGELKAGNEEELKKVTRLHTATHLLHAALRKVLGDEVHQAGSDITAERLRFDFSFPRKMTPEETKKVEDIVNDAVGRDLPVTMQEMPYEEALKKGAMAFFKQKYPPIVKMYIVGPDDAPFSRELCGGPHVSHTAEIGRFNIIKEEAISSGVRRVRATVE